MNITEQELDAIIKDELQKIISENEEVDAPLDDLSQKGVDGKLSTTDQTKKMKQDATKASSLKITTGERSMIEKIKDTLVAYAEKNNLEAGNIYNILNKVNKAMTKKL